MIENLFSASNDRVRARFTLLRKPLCILFLSCLFGFALGITSEPKIATIILNTAKYPITFAGLQIAYIFPLLLIFVAIFCCSSRFFLALLFIKSFCFSYFATIFLSFFHASIFLVFLNFVSTLTYAVLSFVIYIRIIQGRLTNRSIILLTTVISIFAFFDYFVASPFLSAVIIQWKG